MEGSDPGRTRAAGTLPAEVRALIYDFDDTIVESERINDVLFSGLLEREYGISLTREELDCLYGFPWSGVFDWLEQHRPLGRPREEVWRRFMEVKREYLSRNTLRVASGIERMLELPVTQGIVSGSTREELALMLANIGIRADSVALILSDDDCPRGKPDPQGYLMALERLRVQPHQAIVFEDSEPGIEAARRAGIPVAFVAELASRDNGAQADMRFETFVQAWERIRSSLGRS